MRLTPFTSPSGKILSIAAGLALAAASLSGCAGGSNANNDTSTSAASSSPTPEPSTQSPSPTPVKVLTEEQLKGVVTSLQDPSGGAYNPLTTAQVQNIASGMKTMAKAANITPAECIDAMYSTQIDFSLPGLNVSGGASGDGTGGIVLASAKDNDLLDISEKAKNAIKKCPAVTAEIAGTTNETAFSDVPVEVAGAKTFGYKMITKVGSAEITALGLNAQKDNVLVTVSQTYPKDQEPDVEQLKKQLTTALEKALAVA